MPFTIEEKSLPDSEVWNRSTGQSVYQSQEWASVYKQYRSVRRFCFVAYKGSEPIAYLLCFGWKKWPYALFWSGSAGAGGGPVFSDAVPSEERKIIKGALLTRAFDAAREKKYTNVVLYTYPGDANEVALENVDVATKQTPILFLDASVEEIFGRFAQKTRQYINGAGRTGVSVSLGTREDLIRYREWQLAFARMRGLPLSRVNTIAEMESSWDALIDANRVKLYVARLGEKILGMSLILYSRDTMFHHSVMIASDAEKGFHAPHALQWKVIQDALEQKLHAYNFVGAPDREGSLGGTTEFKLKFGAELTSFKRYSRHTDTLLIRAIKKIFKKIGLESEAPIIFYP